jgi:hypothetical protein
VRVLAALLFFACASPALAEVWTVREGECGEWQARWVVDQERSGVWSGSIEQIHIGGPCERRTSRIRRSNVRAVIHGDNVFAVRRPIREASVSRPLAGRATASTVPGECSCAKAASDRVRCFASARA